VHAEPLDEIRSHIATGLDGEALRTSNLLNLDTERLSDTDAWNDEKGLAWSSKQSAIHFCARKGADVFGWELMDIRHTIKSSQKGVALLNHRSDYIQQSHQTLRS
jgi:hypothetical protein